MDDLKVKSSFVAMFHHQTDKNEDGSPVVKQAVVTADDIGEAAHKAEKWADANGHKVHSLNAGPIVID